MTKEKEVKIMSLADMTVALKDRRLYRVAKAIKVSYPTLKKIVDGEYGNFTMATLEKISKYLQQSTAAEKSSK